MNGGLARREVSTYTGADVTENCCNIFKIVAGFEHALSVFALTVYL